MGYKESRKLRSRLVVVIISILSCIAVMGVGVYAASSNFSVSVSNSVSFTFASVDGKIWAKRVGDVIYGAESKDNGDSATTKNNDKIKDADENGYLLLYDRQQEVAGETDYAADNINEIKKPVNFLTHLSKNESNMTRDDIKPGTLKITYVFKYEFAVASNANVVITLTDKSTNIDENNPAYGKVKTNYKYLYSASDPSVLDWSNQNLTWEYITDGIMKTYSTTLVSKDDEKTAEIEGVDPTRPETYTIYILAELEVAETNSLAAAYTLGMRDNKEDFYLWAFHLSFTPQI